MTYRKFTNLPEILEMTSRGRSEWGVIFYVEDLDGTIYRQSIDVDSKLVVVEKMWNGEFRAASTYSVEREKSNARQLMH